MYDDNHRDWDHTAEMLPLRPLKEEAIGCQLVDPWDQDICLDPARFPQANQVPIVKQINDGEVVEVEDWWLIKVGAATAGSLEKKVMQVFNTLAPSI